MANNLIPCKVCGKTPALRSIDVTSVSIAHYLRCECGRGTSWNFKPEACGIEWNKMNHTDHLVVTVKPDKPMTHAMSVLARRKEAYGGA